VYFKSLITICFRAFLLNGYNQNKFFLNLVKRFDIYWRHNYQELINRKFGNRNVKKIITQSITRCFPSSGSEKAL
jgi:hypothetical protein